MRSAGNWKVIPEMQPSSAHIFGRASNGRRGQTLILALAILFLMVVVAGIFVTMILRNLTRMTRQHSTDNALALAIAGIQHAAQQFRISPDGADWRPQISEALWATPNPPVISVPCAGCPPQVDPDQDGTLDGNELRLLDPDYKWLSDNGTYNNPFVRFSTGDGRFLLRVTYLPAFRFASAASEQAGTKDLFDSNSFLVHIESIGRPGDFNPNDPSFFTQDSTLGTTNAAGRFRKVDAYVPLGLVDQLWWVTNQTGENGPANIGVPPFQDGNGNTVQYNTLFQGGVRSNADTQFNGNVVIRVLPSRGEGVVVNGQILTGPRLPPGGPNPPPQVQVQVMQDIPGVPLPANPSVPPDSQGVDPTKESLIANGKLVASQGAFSTLSLPDSGGQIHDIAVDSQQRKNESNDLISSARSATIQVAPPLDQMNPETGVLRWLQLTRDSGHAITVKDSTGKSHLINTGCYGLVDQSLPVTVRAGGLYLDNFDDVQYPKNRPAVKDEWLRREQTGLGWQGDYYTPTIGATPDHPLRLRPTPIIDVFFTQQKDAQSGLLVPAVQVTRWDPDVRQQNLQPSPQPNQPRLFYALQGVQQNGTGGTMVPLGTTRTFPIPENGVIFSEGSIRVHGTYGTGAVLSRPLTVVSGGTIYVEGSLLQFRGGGGPIASASGWQIGLLAMDSVVMNPTAGAGLAQFSQLSSGVLPPSGKSLVPGRVPYFQFPPGSDADLTIRPALDAINQANNPLMLLLKHSGKFENNLSQTHVDLGLPSAGPTPFTQYNWETVLPPNFQAAGHPGFYLFHFIPAGAPVTWDESNYQSPTVPPTTWEQKGFVLPAVVPPTGGDLTFRLRAGTDTSPDEQDYMLAKAAVVPAFTYDQQGNVSGGQPLPMRVEAVIYAYHGSWFVIPPPYFNDNSADQSDTRANYVASSHQRSVNGGVFPTSPNEDVPFYHEPLNVDVQLLGSVTENMPADQSDQAAWVKQMWTSPSGFDYTQFPPAGPTPPYAPNLRYQYDSDLRRMVRVRILHPYVDAGGVLHDEEVAWVAPGASRGPRPLGKIVAEALANNSFVQTLPLLPKLPASAVLYEGSAF